MNENVPPGWTVTLLPDIAQLNMGQSPPSTSYNDNVDGLPFFQGKTEFGRLYPKPVKYCRAPLKIAEANDILISVRAPVGPTNLCSVRSCIGRGLAAIRPRDQVPSKYLLYYFRSIEGWLSQQGTGSTFTAISKSDLEAIELPLAPLGEQQRIAAKLETLLGKVDSCTDRLQRIPTILKRFHQSVLVAACSGRLTADWREQHSTGDKNGLTTGGFDNEFPETWRPTNLGMVASLVTSGSRGWAKYYAETGSTFIRAQNINSDVLKLDDVAFVKLPNRTEGVRTKVRRDDILVTITGANVTKSALVDVDLEDAYISQHVALVRFHEPKLAAFLFLWTVSPSHGRRQLQDAAYGQGKPGLNLDNIRDVDVMMPPVDEQIEIVRRVESLFTLADQLEVRYKKGKAYVDKLTQSILAKAFRGELVPQDPNDEPAEKLLERIRAGTSAKSRAPRSTR